MLREAADVLRLSTRELGGLNIRGFRGALPVQQGPPSKMGCVTLAPTSQKPAPPVNRWPRTTVILPESLELSPIDPRAPDADFGVDFAIVVRGRDICVPDVRERFHLALSGGSDSST